MYRKFLCYDISFLNKNIARFLRSVVVIGFVVFIFIPSRQWNLLEWYFQRRLMAICRAKCVLRELVANNSHQTANICQAFKSAISIEIVSSLPSILTYVKHLTANCNGNFIYSNRRKMPHRKRLLYEHFFWVDVHVAIDNINGLADIFSLMKWMVEASVVIRDEKMWWNFIGKWNIQPNESNWIS